MIFWCNRQKFGPKTGGVFRALELESQILAQNRGGVYEGGGVFGMKGTVYVVKNCHQHSYGFENLMSSWGVGI